MPATETGRPLIKGPQRHTWSAHSTPEGTRQNAFSRIHVGWFHKLLKALEHPARTPPHSASWERGRRHTAKVNGLGFEHVTTVGWVFFTSVPLLYLISPSQNLSTANMFRKIWSKMAEKPETEPHSHYRLLWEKTESINVDYALCLWT